MTSRPSLEGEGLRSGTRVVMVRSLPLSRDTRVRKEAEALARAGMRVTVILWDRDGSLSAASKGSPCEWVAFGVRVPFGDIRVALYLPLWWAYVFYQLMRRPCDVVHAVDLDTYAPSLVAAKIRGRRIVYAMYDYYADMIEFPIARAFMRQMVAGLDRRLTRRADALILVDESRMEQVGPDANPNIWIVMNAPPDVLSGASLRARASGPLRIYFGGGVQRDRGIHDAIQAVARMPDVHLEVVGPCGSSAYERELEALARHIPNVRLHLRPVPHERILASTLEADVLFALYSTEVANNQYASPNKLFEAMMCAKPILVNEGTAMARIVLATGCGMVIPYGDARAIEAALRSLAEDPEARAQMGQRGREAYEREYAWSRMEARLVALYANVLEARAA